MTVVAVEHAVALCQRHLGAHFGGPRPELVGSADAALGVALPQPYRRWVERLGAASIGPFEMYGLVSEPFDGPIPDGVWATLSSRRGPSHLPRPIQAQTTETKTTKEARRALKRRISDVIYRQLCLDAEQEAGPGGQTGTTLQSSVTGPTSTTAPRTSHNPDPNPSLGL